MNVNTKIKCPVCNNATLDTEVSDYSTFVKDGLREVRIIVKDLERQKCPKCGEEFLPPASLEKVTNEKYLRLDLLPPGELKAIREKLGRTQEEMSDLLGVGKKSYFRWENGLSIQNKSMDRYVRIVAQNPDNVSLLRKLQAEKEHPYDKDKINKYLKSFDVIEIDSEAERPVAHVGHEVEIEDDLRAKVEGVILKYLKEQKDD